MSEMIYTHTNIAASDWKGLAHIAFAVPDVRTTVDAVMESGGSLLGSVVRKEYEELGTLTVAYCADPEGNYIEVQNWS